MFKELFPAFKVKLVDFFSFQNKKLWDAYGNRNSTGREVQRWRQTQNHEFGESSKVGKVNPLIPAHK